VPIKPVVVKPRPARVEPLNVALLTIGVLLEYAGSILKRPNAPPNKNVPVPETLDPKEITESLKVVVPVSPYPKLSKSKPVQIVAGLGTLAPE
jgi:hypothetical protein